MAYEGPIIQLDQTEIPIRGYANIQDIGHVPFEDNQFVGTRGQGRRLEGFSLEILPPPGSNLAIRYMAHIENYGDMPWVTGPTFIGTEGQGLRLEGFAIEVFGYAPGGPWGVEYMAHQEENGDIRLPPPNFSDGEFCGSRGMKLRIEGIALTIIKAIGQVEQP